MVLVAASGNTSWVCDPSLASYALEQPEMLRSPDYKHKCHASFKCAPTLWVYPTSLKSAHHLGATLYTKTNGLCQEPNN